MSAEVKRSSFVDAVLPIANQVQSVSDSLRDVDVSELQRGLEALAQERAEFLEESRRVRTALDERARSLQQLRANLKAPRDSQLRASFLTVGAREIPEIATLSHRLTGVETQTHRLSEAQVKCNQAVNSVRENTKALTKLQTRKFTNTKQSWFKSKSGTRRAGNRYSRQRQAGAGLRRDTSPSTSQSDGAPRSRWRDSGAGDRRGLCGA